MPTAANVLVKDRMISVIRGEFNEMPGMRLTPAQFRRLWHLDEPESDAFIQVLVADGFLRKDRAGQLHRALDAH